MFVDRVKINLKAGKGGSGLVAFRREKYVPLGGPSGGDGGKGGDIVFVVDTNKSTLLDLRFNRLIKSDEGGIGKTKKMHGADGEVVIVKVPLGTVIYDNVSGAMLADLTKIDQEAIIAKGGRGGRGNWHFSSSRNSAPEYAEMGEPGENREIRIELKLLADVGIVGFPSVGKSTLLSVVSKAKPEIADYHFTTIVPNLGVIQVKDGRSFVMADLPGLIKGAAQGKGLGHQFLRHIERCRVILHVIDMGSHDGRDPVEDYKVINDELSEYQLRLKERPQIVVANKMDLDGAAENLVRFKEAYPNIEVFETVTIIQEGLDDVLYRLADVIAVTPEFLLVDDAEISEGVLFKFLDEGPVYDVSNLGNHKWKVTGERVDKLFDMTDFTNTQNVYRFASILKKMGVEDSLREAGCTEGDIVSIKDYAFEFVER